MEPIKRHKSLHPLSHDHHEGLVLCFRISAGLNKGTEADRMNKYADWFYHNHLLQHFETEEKLIFPLLGMEHELIQQALNEHKKLNEIFSRTNKTVDSLKEISVLLEAHIRFEERILFNKIQEATTEEILKDIHIKTSSETCSIMWSDEFW